MRRALLLALAVSTTIVTVPGTASALVTPKAVIRGPEDAWQAFANDTYLAWATNTAAHPNHYNAVVRPLAGGTRVMANARGTEGFPGGFDPGSNRLILEQCGKKDCGIYFYDVVTKRRWKVRGVNSANSDWQPRVSTEYVLFLRSRYAGGHWYNDVLLYNRSTHRTRRLDTYRSSTTIIRTGNVGDRYATFMTIKKSRWLAWLYDAETKTLRKIPTANDRPQWGPVVDEAGGSVYVWRSGNACGSHSSVFRIALPMKDSGTKILELPKGVDSGFVSSIAPDPAGGIDLYFPRAKCTVKQLDVYVAQQVDTT